MWQAATSKEVFIASKGEGLSVDITELLENIWLLGFIMNVSHILRIM